MKSTRPLKMIALCGAAAALAVMGAVTMATGSTGAGSTVVAVTGNTVVSTTPPTVPAVQRAAPPVKATTFVGGDWPGMGAMGEDWAK